MFDLDKIKKWKQYDKLIEKGEDIFGKLTDDDLGHYVVSVALYRKRQWHSFLYAICVQGRYENVSDTVCSCKQSVTVLQRYSDTVKYPICWSYPVYGIFFSTAFHKDAYASDVDLCKYNKRPAICRRKENDI